VATELRKQLPLIKNPIVTNDIDIMQSLNALAEGKVFDPYRQIEKANTAATKIKKMLGRHGLTWGINEINHRASQGFQANCHGAPLAPMDNIYNGSCNPYEGDTLCKVSLPILCFLPSENTLAVSTPHIGDTMVSRAVADKQCSTQYGTGWRMAEHHDDGAGWEINAYGTPPTSLTRFWVAINDQSANCWDK
jgi:hypothetical protein